MEQAPRYPIRAVSRLTGVPVDTLRAWERRYRVVEPARDRRGRLYGEADVRKLRLLRLLVDRGHPIGRLVSLPERDLLRLQTEADPPAPGRAAEEAGPEALLAALERFDAAGADRELRRLATLLAPRRLVREVALPLMRRIGERWADGRLAISQEHLASGLLRSLLGAMVRVHAPEEPRVSLLFATPPGEPHEFGVLAAALLAAGGGLGVVYLGTDLPAAEIAECARRTSARVVVLGVVGARGTDEAVRAVERLGGELPAGVQLWVGGPPNQALEAAVARASGSFVPDFDALEQRLLQLGARL
jgi:DNA-binding transcriptional MerR regulator/methylmalonyl-CoA mutase cobalamin-binding subunit